MRILDTLLGKTKPVEANLDSLFSLPSAAVTLEAEAGLVLSGSAGVCFKPPSGQPFEETQQEIRELLTSQPAGQVPEAPLPSVRQQSDSFGYRWLLLEDPTTEGLVTAVHMVNSTLQDHGYGPQLLCSVFSLKGGEPGRAYLVYLYKRGTFYPFVPTGKETRDNEAELRLRAVVEGDLKVEDDLTRWFPLWDIPVG